MSHTAFPDHRSNVYSKFHPHSLNGLGWASIWVIFYISGYLKCCANISTCDSQSKRKIIVTTICYARIVIFLNVDSKNELKTYRRSLTDSRYITHTKFNVFYAKNLFKINSFFRENIPENTTLKIMYICSIGHWWCCKKASHQLRVVLKIEQKFRYLINTLKIASSRESNPGRSVFPGRIVRLILQLRGGDEIP